jgi:hypothetical protein
MDERAVRKQVFDYLKHNLSVEVINASTGSSCGGEVPGELAVEVRLHLTDPWTGKPEVISTDKVTLE